MLNLQVTYSKQETPEEQARQKEMINAVERTVKRILNRALYSSFTTWKGHVHLIKDRQRSARRLVRISRSLSLSLSCDTRTSF